MTDQKSSFVYSPRFTTEFVGLGPYQLTRWDAGVLMEFRRFDAYYRGRPTLDGIAVRFLADPNTLVANLLSGAVDALFSIQNILAGPQPAWTPNRYLGGYDAQMACGDQPGLPNDLGPLTLTYTNRQHHTRVIA